MKNTIIRMRTGIAAAALAASSLPVVLVQAPAGAVDAAVSEHKVYVAEITNKGTPPTVATVEAEVDKALDRMEAETDGKLSMERVGEVAEFATATDCSSRGALYGEAKALPALAGVDWNGRNHLIVVTAAPCFDGGIGSNPVGFGFEHGGEVMLSFGGDVTKTFVHELSHNFGLGHAGAVVLNTDGSWTFGEYGNRYSPMGTGITGSSYQPAALDSFERTMLGVSTPAEVPQLRLPADRRVRTFEYDLHGRGTDAGVRGLQLTDPKDGATYFVDFRSGAGRDRESYYGVKDYATYTGSWNKGVTVEKIFNNGTRDVTDLQRHIGADGKTRYALTTGQSYRTDNDANGQEIGLKVEVTQMQVTGSADDLATVKVTLTDERVPFAVQTGSVSISGRGGAGDTMTASVGPWTAGSSLSDIAWYDGEAAIPGAVGTTYVIPASLQGHLLSARVTGTQESYAPLTATSNVVEVGKGLQGFLEAGSVYEIRSVSTGLLLTDPGSSQVAAKSSPAAGSTSAQRWRVDSVHDDGSFRLINESSRKCLDNSGSGTAVGNPTIRYSCHDYNNQRWTIVGSGTGYTLVNLKSQKSVAPASTSDGALVAQTGGTYAWTFTKVG